MNERQYMEEMEHREGCHECGDLVSWQDVADGRAKHEMVTPDAYMTPETWDTLCRKCYPNELYAHLPEITVESVQGERIGWRIDYFVHRGLGLVDNNPNFKGADVPHYSTSLDALVPVWNYIEDRADKNETINPEETGEYNGYIPLTRHNGLWEVGIYWFTIRT